MRALAFALLLSSTLTSHALAAKKQAIDVTWLGHATFEITSAGGTTLLIDPFIANNPATPEAYKDLSRYKPAAILVSHSHFDHAADVVAIAKASGAKVVSAFDYVGNLGLPEAQQLGGNVGGSFVIGDVTVHLVPAMHSSEPGGRPLGFVIVFADGRKIYHTGDTWVFGDMALVQEIHRPDILLFNMGGGPFTQSPEQAAWAIKKYFKPKVIVPMHFGTFPPLATEADVKKAFSGDKRLTILTPGEAKSL